MSRRKCPEENLLEKKEKVQRRKIAKKYGRYILFRDYPAVKKSPGWKYLIKNLLKLREFHIKKSILKPKREDWKCKN
jgi:hypothetical protein